MAKAVRETAASRAVLSAAMGGTDAKREYENWEGRKMRSAQKRNSLPIKKMQVARSEQVAFCGTVQLIPD